MDVYDGPSDSFSPNGCNQFFCYNFYTRHSLAAALGKFTDGESKIVGTVKFTNLDTTNHYRVSQGIEQLKDTNRGGRVKVQAYNKHSEYERLQNQHAAQQHRLTSMSPFIPL
jgi:hypothetical protein